MELLQDVLETAVDYPLLQVTEAAEPHLKIAYDQTTMLVRALKGMAAAIFPRFGVFGSTQADVDFIFPQVEDLDSSYGYVGPAGALSLQRLLLNDDGWKAFVSDYRVKLGPSSKQGPLLDKVEAALLTADSYISDPSFQMPVDEDSVKADQGVQVC